MARYRLRGLPPMGASSPAGLDPWITLDGRLAAPAASAFTFTNSGLLVPYPSATAPNGRLIWPANGAFQPPWRVAGVDYPVGPRVTTFKIPGVDTPPAGISVDNTNKIFNLTASNVTLSGWDFSGGGGWQVFGGNTANSIGSNLSCVDCIFKVGTLNQRPIQLFGIDNFGSTATGFSASYCIFDGIGGDTGTSDGIIHCGWSGNINITYSFVGNGSTDLMDLGANFTSANVPCNLTLTNNYITQSGTDPAGHADWLQTAESDTGTDGRLYGPTNINWNTVVQTSFPVGGGSQGFTLDANTKTAFTEFRGGFLNNNTIIVTSPTGELPWVFRIAKDCSSQNWQGNQNYFDPTGLSTPVVSHGFFASVGSGPFNGSVITSGNINMNDGTSMNNSF